LLVQHGLARLGKNYSRACNPALRLWAEAAGPITFAKVLDALPKEHCLSTALMELWCELQELWKDRSDARDTIAHLLAATFPILGTEPDHTDDDLASAYDSPVKLREIYEPALFLRFLRCLEARPAPDDLHAFLIMVSINETSFPPDDLILPALEQISAATPAVISTGTAETLWQTCAACWLQRSAMPPPPPSNWTLPLTERQLKGLRADLKAFALDPETKEMRFRVRKELRQQIHRIIDSRQLDMTHVTERRGSPYTLVCKKTRGPYERACRQYNKDVGSMQRLLRLPSANSPANAPYTTQLAAALRASRDPAL
jgi:hypothetical protein